MTKRAFSLLFTLLVFFYCTTTASAQQYVNDVVVAGTDFLSKTGNYPCSFSDLIFYGEENMSSSWTKKSGTTPGKGNYAITNGSLYGGEKNSNDTFFSHMIDGLLTTSGHNNYTIKIYFKAVGRVEVQALWKKPGTNNQQNKQLQTDGTSSEISLEFSITATSSSFSYQFQRQGGQGTIQVTKVEVIGDTEAKITSSLGFDVCAGNTTTLQVLGHTGSYQWQRSENATGPWTNIQGATSSRLDVEVNKAYYYKVGNIVSEELAPTMCCAYESNPNYIKEVRFTMTGTRPEGLPQGATIDQTPGSGYKFYTAGAESNKIEDGEYAVVHKTTDGGYWADAGFVSKIVGKDYTGPSSNDGFLLVNCNPSNSGKPMYEQIVTGLCPGAMHNFSVSVVSVDINPAHEGIAVKMQVYAMNGNTVGEALLRNPISIRKSCGEGWGDPYSASITTPAGCTSVKISVINANTSGRNEGNDVGIDDILFSRCNPEIALYSDAAFTMTDQTVCPSTTTATALYVSEPANLNAIFPTSKYYYYEFKNATGNWEAVTGATNPTTSAIFPVTLTATTTYRVWVAADATTVVKAAEGQISNTDCTSYAVSNAVTLTHDCLCEASTAPTANGYEACPSTTKLDLNSLITSTKTGGTIRWYDSETATTPMSATDAAAVDVSTSKAGTTRNYYVTYQKNDDPVTGDEYCESSRTKVEVKVKAAISLTFDKDITTPISGCLANMTEADRTITITNASSINTTTTEILWNKGTRDASGAFVEGTELTKNATKYTLANAAEAGTIRITAQYTGTTQNCPAVYYVDYNLSEAPGVKVDNVSTPCKQDLQTTGVTIKLKDISGSDKLSVYRSFDEGTTYSQLGTTITLPAGTATYEYKDTDFAHLAGSTDDVKVKYKFILGDPTSNCKGEAFTDVYTISNTNRFELVVTGAEEVVDGTNIKYTVCEGTISPKLEIQTNYTLKEGENFLWYVKDLGQDDSQYQIPADIDQTLVAQINTGVFADELDRSIVVKAVIVAQPGYTTCGGEAIVTIYVDKKPEPSLASINPICLGNAATFTLSEGNAEVTAATYVLKEVGVTAAINNDLKVGVAYDHTPTTQGTHTYQVTATNGVCLSNSTTIEVEVASKPTFEVEADKDAICQGEDVTLTLKNYPAASTEYYWVDASSSNQQAVVTVNPTSVGKVTYVASVTAVCTDTMQVHVQVDAPINATIQPVSPICLGESTTLQVVGSEDYKYEWSPFNDCATPYKQNTVVTPSAAGEYTFVVAITTVNETCNDEQSVTLQVNDNPRIVHLDTCGIRQVMVEAEGGKAPYNYQIDKYPDLYFHGESGAVKFSEVPIGFHRMYITDDTGCSADSLFEIPAIPIKPEKYFTPNGIGDDKSNLWTVEDLDENYTSYIVEIYDRYGRKLYEYRTGSFNVDGANSSEELGWDGTYNGHQMPSDDYWYLITVEEIRKQYTGHFTLKR